MFSVLQESHDSRFLATPMELMKASKSFYSSVAILLAAHLDIFSILFSSSGMTCNKLARKLTLNSDKLDVLLKALVSLGLLHCQKEKYTTTLLSIKYLTAQSKYSFLALIQHYYYMWQNWITLPALLKGNRFQKSIILNNQEANKTFCQAMRCLHAGPARKLAHMMRIARGGIVIDVGGAGGAFSTALLEKDHTLNIKIIDYPKSLLNTKNILYKNANYRQIRFIADKFYTTRKWPIATKADAIICTYVCHCSSFVSNISLLKKIRSGLKPDGFLLLVDYALNKNRSIPKGLALFSLNMIASTESGRCYTNIELINMMKRAGYKNIKRVQSGVFIARK